MKALTSSRGARLWRGGRPGICTRGEMRCRVMRLTDPRTGEIALFTREAEKIRVDPETAAYLLSETHRDRILVTMLGAAPKRSSRPRKKALRSRS